MKFINKLLNPYFYNRKPTTPSFSNKKSAGFTLIELLLVVVLISVLSGVIISVVNVAGLRARSRDAQRAGDIKRIQTALELYFSDNRGYPQNSATWLNILSAGAAADVLNTALKGTYIPVIPQDPRNTEIVSPVPTCSGSISTSYGYYYRTDACVGVGCKSARYVIATYMESQSAAESSTCNKLSNCTGGTPAVSACNCAVPCYGVENPL